MKILTLLAMIFTSACALADPSPENLPDCAKVPAMKLTVQMYHLDLNDRREICVISPGLFKITIHNPQGSNVAVNPGDVYVLDKKSDLPGGYQCGAAPPTTATVYGDNCDNKNLLAVYIKSNAALGLIPFWIHVKDVGTLDPTVRVIGKGAFLTLTSLGFQEEFNLLGLQPADINEVLEMLKKSAE